ncbi:hypothetical protein [Allorhizocola rhizosphaerae]|uniref:hypothetical protein n=1 Tax=Allorhizocola rhizosphaerae TaxID=1872709 RepID=UPI0013C30CA2|nr:hypothetical protein [Allorhizocola rhizosphaerae]
MINGWLAYRQLLECVLGKYFLEGFRIDHTFDSGDDDGADLVLINGPKKIFVQCKTYHAEPVSHAALNRKVRESAKAAGARLDIAVIPVARLPFTQEIAEFGSQAELLFEHHPDAAMMLAYSAFEAALYKTISAYGDAFVCPPSPLQHLVDVIASHDDWPDVDETLLMSAIDRRNRIAHGLFAAETVVRPEFDALIATTRQLIQTDQSRLTDTLESAFDSAAIKHSLARNYDSLTRYLADRESDRTGIGSTSEMVSLARTVTESVLAAS